MRRFNVLTTTFIIQPKNKTIAIYLRRELQIKDFFLNSVLTTAYTAQPKNKTTAIYFKMERQKKNRFINGVQFLLSRLTSDNKAATVTGTSLHMKATVSISNPQMIFLYIEPPDFTEAWTMHQC